MKLLLNLKLGQAVYFVERIKPLNWRICSVFQGEGKMKKVSLVSGQLLCLEHAVQQDYFSQHHASMLHVFISK